jgi:hypothetical protein
MLVVCTIYYTPYTTVKMLNSTSLTYLLPSLPHPRVGLTRTSPKNFVARLAFCEFHTHKYLGKSRFLRVSQHREVGFALISTENWTAAYYRTCKMETHDGQACGHAEWPCSMDMQRGHAAGACSRGMQQRQSCGHAELPCSMDMQCGHAAGACSRDMQYRHTAWIHGKGAWT